MKKAMVLAMTTFENNGWLATGEVKLVAQVHDEFQVECDAGLAQVVGTVLTTAIRLAGEDLGCRCELAGEYDVGINWSETH